VQRRGDLTLFSLFSARYFPQFDPYRFGGSTFLGMVLTTADEDLSHSTSILEQLSADASAPLLRGLRDEY
jgi:hypothetical protein